MRETEVRIRQRWTVIIPCIALTLGIGLSITACQNGSLRSEAILDVIYPIAYAFDDLDTQRKVREQNPVEENLIEALNDFSYRTGALILTDAGKNINYSPLSLYYAFSIAASGAGVDSGTEAELLTLLGVPDVLFLSEPCGNLYRALYCDNEIGKLKIANSIWMDDDMNGELIVFKDDFVKLAAENFYASSHSVDFSSKETGKAMAEWISANTNGTLSPTFDTNPGTDQILSMLNTVYFYDQWIDRFDINKTAEDVFHLMDGGDNTVKCDFMNQTFNSAGFEKGEGYTRAGLGLKNADRMVFILPDNGVSPYELLSSPDRIRETFEGGEHFNGKVVWKIPKFGFSSKLALIDVLKSLGINSAFTPDADFTRITEHMAFITDVRQETYIAIDENGVEASAFTQIEYAGAAQAEGRADMILDRPFIYGITARNGSLLFLGVCMNPAAE